MLKGKGKKTPYDIIISNMMYIHVKTLIHLPYMFKYTMFSFTTQYT